MDSTSPVLHPPSYTTYTLQSTSPLFTTLPPELRTQIFTYALSPYEDHSNPYQKETYWTRPGYNAPHKTDTALLRTCKAIYAETWFMPFALAEHIFYLTGSDRAPKAHIAGDGAPGLSFAGCLEQVHRAHTEQAKSEESGTKPLETGNIQIFAQLYKLEPGTAFQRLLDTPFLRPRQVRLTLRYTDFWYWEDNRRLYIDGKWVRVLRFPESVARFVVDFESLERRKGEVDLIVRQAVERWVFRREDGRVLIPAGGDGNSVVSRWTGSSVFGGRRWIRDEVRPGELDYYIVTATWAVASAEESAKHAGLFGKDAESKPNVAVPGTFTQPVPPLIWPTFITELDMREARVTMEMGASEAWEAVRALRDSRRRAIARLPAPRQLS